MNLPPSFRQAKARLLSLQTVDYDAAATALRRLDIFLAICAVAAEHEPDILAERARDTFCHTLIHEPSVVEEKGVALLGKLMPINEDALLEYLQEDDRDSWVIPIQCVNLAGSWDEFGEILMEPEHLSPSWAAILFAHLLVYECDDASVWERASLAFGWPVTGASNDSWIRLHLDGEKFLASLEAEGLGDWKAAFLMAMHSTGSIFLDMSYDDSGLEAFDLTLENVQALAQEWKTGKEIIETAERAALAAQQNPQQYARALALFEAALYKKKER